MALDTHTLHPQLPLGPLVHQALRVLEEQDGSSLLVAWQLLVAREIAQPPAASLNGSPASAATSQHTAVVGTHGRYIEAPGSCSQSSAGASREAVANVQVLKVPVRVRAPQLERA